MSSGRIALLFDGFDQGGIGRVNLTLAAYMLEAGLNVDLLVFSASGPRKDEVPTGARVINLAGAGNLSLVIALNRYFRATQSLQGIIASSVLLAPHVGFSASLAGRNRLPILCIHHVDMRRAIDRQGRLRRLAQRTLTIAAERLLSVKLAAVSDGARNGVVESLRIAPHKVKVIGNPVELVAPGTAIPDDILAWWKMDGVVSLLSIGRLAPEKGFTYLIEAVDLLRKSMVVRLVIVGSGPYEPTLQNLVIERGLLDHVRLVGFVPQPRRYYKYADVFVLASLTEAMSLCLLEAMSAGTQVVSTDCDFGPREILDDGLFGRLVEVGSPHALAEGVLAAIRQPIDSTFLAARAAEFSPKRVLDVYLSELGVVKQ